MKIIETSIPGLIILEPHVFQDSRGYFFESYQVDRYRDAGIHTNFVQDNESKSDYGVIRGLHYQLEPWAQTKLVRVISGAVYDVAVDLRKGSPTFGQWFGIELDGESKKQLLIPRGFAHGFSVLSETAVFSYKCDRLYHRESERAISFRDPALGIDWKIQENRQVISEKDLMAPVFDQAEKNFQFNG